MADLERLGGTDAELQWDRGDVTAVLNALRCGIDLAHVLDLAPGLVPRRLLAAYRHLEDSRAAAIAAWMTIAGDPTMSNIAEHGAAAALLLPTPMYRMASLVRRQKKPTALSVIRELLSDMDQLNRRVSELEQHLASLSYPDTTGTAVELGCLLYQPYRQGLWGHPYYIPTRVGTLTPTRVADLLNEEQP